LHEVRKQRELLLVYHGSNISLQCDIAYDCRSRDTEMIAWVEELHFYRLLYTGRCYLSSHRHGFGDRQASPVVGQDITVSYERMWCAHRFVSATTTIFILYSRVTRAIEDQQY